MISEIAIRNFRSIDSARFDCGDITTFVGKNDAGKSNVLRALNLFFNGQTDHGIAFDFKRDFNQFVKVPAKKAPEIRIDLTLRLPYSYQRDDSSKFVVWRKVWRQSGPHEEGNWRAIKGREPKKGKVIELFPPHSRVPSLLDRIDYRYVPAIKDRTFFADLQGQVYDVLSSVGGIPLQASAETFERQIQAQLPELVNAINVLFGYETVLKLPENLRKIFETLEFNTEGIPLSRRGDGIKIRHIPEILRFMADKRNSLHRKGICPHIWGFEEPENNLEMGACNDMAQQFLSLVSDQLQLFLTTHSPIIYGLGTVCEASGSNIKSYFVRRIGKSSEIKPVNQDNVDVEMGFMPLVAPYVLAEQQKWDSKVSELEVIIKDYEDSSDKGIPHLFVEGRTDEKVIRRAIEVSFPGAATSIAIDSGGKTGKGGASAAASRGHAWQLMQQHQDEPVRGSALFDDDKSGRDAKKKLNDILNGASKATKHVKAVRLTVSNTVLELRKKKFKIAFDLEASYSDGVWEHAEAQGWLQERVDLHSICSDKLQKQIINTGFEPKAGLSDAQIRRLELCFTIDGKLAAANYIASLSDADAQVALEALEASLLKVLRFLLPNQDLYAEGTVQ